MFLQNDGPSVEEPARQMRPRSPHFPIFNIGSLRLKRRHQASVFWYYRRTWATIWRGVRRKASWGQTIRLPGWMDVRWTSWVQQDLLPIPDHFQTQNRCPLDRPLIHPPLHHFSLQRSFRLAWSLSWTRFILGALLNNLLWRLHDTILGQSACMSV